MISIKAHSLDETIAWLESVPERCDNAIQKTLADAPLWRPGARAVADSALKGANLEHEYAAVIDKFLDTIISVYEQNEMGIRGYFVVNEQEQTPGDGGDLVLTADIDPGEITDEYIDNWIEVGKAGIDGGKRLTDIDKAPDGSWLPTEVIRSRIRNGMAKDPFGSSIQRLIASIVMMNTSEYGFAVSEDVIHMMCNIVADAWENMSKELEPVLGNKLTAELKHGGAGKLPF